jgi:large exoprotein involved in heme utilization and adhesion
LGAVAGPGTVDLSVAGNQIQLNVPQTILRADLSLTNGTVVDTVGLGGGDIQLVGRRITVEDSRVESTTLGARRGGNLTVNGSESVDIIGKEAGGQFSNGLFADTRGTGAAGNLNVTTGRLTVRGEARISAATYGAGQGGNLTANAAESVELIGVDSNDLQLFTGLLTDAESTGAAGDLTVNTRRLIVRDGAQVSAATFGEGAGGKLTVNATDSVELIGVTPSDLLASGLYTAVNATGTGKAGDLEVNTRRLTVRDGAQIFAGTLGPGDGGNLVVNASDSVEVAGVSPILLYPGGLASTADDLLVSDMGLTVGNAGNLTINTKKLMVRDGAQVAAATFGNTGRGGNLTVNALESVEVSGAGPEGAVAGSSALIAGATGGSSDSGTVRINTGQLIVRDEGLVGVSNQGSGNAGNLEVKGRSVVLDNQGSLTAETASGEGGDITLQVDEAVVMRRNSLISAEAGGTGNGGNIEINTRFLIAPENSDIVANAQDGRGGRVTIKAQSVFSTQVRRERTPDSDITASSAAGPQFDGVVDIQTPDVDPSKGTIALPQEVVDATGLVTQGCGAGGVIASSKFTVTGRGGLAAAPGGTIPSEAVLEDLGTAPVRVGRNTTSSAVSTQPTRPSPAPLVEAQGWVLNSKGQVTLTAQAPTVTPHAPWQTTATCQAR